VGCVQACGGTGALRVCAEFLGEKNLGYDTVYVSNPTWGRILSLHFGTGFRN